MPATWACPNSTAGAHNDLQGHMTYMCSDAKRQADVDLIYLATEERKQIVKDKCDSEMFDCDCYLETTIEFFQDAQNYNTILENESENQEKVDAYWDKLYECMAV